MSQTVVMTGGTESFALSTPRARLCVLAAVVAAVVFAARGGGGGGGGARGGGGKTSGSGAAAARLGDPVSTRRPHIVLFVADDLGSNDVSYAFTEGGPRRIATPRIDALAARSVVLERFYALPMCTATRSSLLTGKHAARLGLAHFVLLSNQPASLPLDEVTLPDRLRALGYATHCVGKWHLGFARSAWLPTGRGFDSFFGYALGAQDYFAHDSDEWLEGTIEDRRVSRDSARGHDLWLDSTPLRRSAATDGVHSSELFSARATALVATHEDDAPLFLYYAAQTPHAHYVGAPARHEAAAQAQGFQLSEPRFQIAALVSALDEQAGAVEDAFEARGWWAADTVFVFLGDNGPEPRTGASAFPRRGAKRTLFEGGVNEPCFVYAPQLFAAHSTRVATHVVDLVPTLLALAGGTTGGKLDGRDLTRLLATGHDEQLRSRALLLSYDERARCGALVRGGYKLVRNAPCGNLAPEFVGWGNEWPTDDHACVDRDCLFDLVADPAERRDVAAERPELTRDLAEHLDRWAELAAPSITALTSGDARASPDLHQAQWVPWLDQDDS